MGLRDALADKVDSAGQGAFERRTCRRRFSGARERLTRPANGKQTRRPVNLVNFEGETAAGAER
jgi:hypothetical protein